MDIQGYSNSLNLVIYLVKETNKTISNNKIFQQEEEKLTYILEVEINIVLDSIIIVGIETPLNTVSITLQDNRESD